MAGAVKKFFNKTVVPLLGFFWIFFTGLTLRVKVIGKENEDFVYKNGCVLAFWHSRLFYMPYHFRWQKRWRILVSPSSDGDIINGVLRLFGFYTVRGSSYKQPARALISLARKVKGGASAVMIADGSRGPANAAQPGSAALAKLTGRSIVPLAFGAEKNKRLNSWDKTVLPMPFSRVNMVFGKPIKVDKDSDDKQLELKRLELELELNKITGLADTF
ncbi:MAG: lipoprotein [bacterium]|nr:MAG: lipoprotein [bacterium]